MHRVKDAQVHRFHQWVHGVPGRRVVHDSALRFFVRTGIRVELPLFGSRSLWPSLWSSIRERELLQPRLGESASCGKRGGGAYELFQLPARVQRELFLLPADPVSDGGLSCTERGRHRLSASCRERVLPCTTNFCTAGNTCWGNGRSNWWPS